MSLHGSHHANSEATDLYEQKNFAESSFFHIDDDDDDDNDNDDGDSQSTGDESAEPTPTMLAAAGVSSCPRKIISQWTAQDSADFVAGLGHGMKQYSKGIIGEWLYVGMGMVCSLTNACCRK